MDERWMDDLDVERDDQTIQGTKSVPRRSA
jgi:hypothetical protein